LETVRKRVYKYLDVCPEFVHLVDAAQDGECAAFEEVAQHCIVQEGAVEGCVADSGYLKL
jgi:hypothetical protein